MRRTRSSLWIPWTAVSLAAVWVSAFGCDARQSPVEPTPDCTIALTPASASFEEGGGTASVAVSTAAGCGWSAATDAAWITIAAGRSGSGSGSVVYSVAANAASEARTGSLTVEGQRHSVSQSGRTAPPPVCSYQLNPQGAELDSKDAATGEFAVVAPAGCAWTATSTADWVRVTSGQGSGPGLVAYSVARNTNPDARSAEIVVSDKRFAIRQVGDTGVCQYSVAPVVFEPCMAGGTLSATITTGPGCGWTVSSGAGWLTVVTGGGGSGPANLRLAFTDNYDAPRQGVVEVRWPTPTAGQNIHVRQAGCRYGVSQPQFTFEASGGAGGFDVLQQSEPATCGGATQDRCVWTAVADADWIRVTTSMPRTGDDRVGFQVAAHDGMSPRTGRITVRDRVVTITQSGR